MSFKKKITHSYLRQFLALLDKVSQNRALYIQNPASDFTRENQQNVTLGFMETYALPFRFEQCSLESLAAVLDKRFGQVDLKKSSITRSRAKILPRAYSTPFYHFNDMTRKDRLFKGYHVMAVDGSECKVYGKRPGDTEDSCKSGSKNGGIRHYVHSNFAVDVLENTCLDCITQPASQKNEDKAFIQLVNKWDHILKNHIWLADRGYESLKTFLHCDRNRINMLIRIKDIESSRNILKNLPVPDTEEFDQYFTMYLSRHNVKEHNGIPVKYIAKWRDCPELCSQDFVLVKLRILRVKIIKPDLSILYETLATTLSPEEFTSEDLKTLYHLRWNCETSYRHIKYNLDLEYLHSIRMDLIEQEIFAKMLLYNLCSRIQNELIETKIFFNEKTGTFWKKAGNLTYTINKIKRILFRSPDEWGDHLDFDIGSHTVTNEVDRPDTRHK